MRKRRFLLSILFFIFLSGITTIQAAQEPSATQNMRTHPEDNVKSFDLSGLFNFTPQEQEAAAPARVSVIDRIVLACIDLFLSFACLWLVLLVCVKEKGFVFKRYFGFLVMFHVVWFVFLLLFKLLWEGLDFLVFKLQPDLAQAVSGNFTHLVIITEVIVYLWLIARIFSLKFIGALTVSVLFHAAYFSVIFLFLAIVPAQDDHLHALVRDNLWLKPAIQLELADVDKITSGKHILSFLRFKAFHL